MNGVSHHSTRSQQIQQEDISVWTAERSSKEHGNHSELAMIVCLDNIRRSTLYRIRENRRQFYLSTSATQKDPNGDGAEIEPPPVSSHPAESEPPDAVQANNNRWF
jgi:hypothetical protein